MVYGILNLVTGICTDEESSSCDSFMSREKFKSSDHVVGHKLYKGHIRKLF